MMDNMRIGDQERERAAALLAEHFASGRLSHSEYSERFDAVWTARTGGDLKTLFHDLPAAGRHPDGVSASTVRMTSRRRHGFRLPGVLWLVLVVLLVVLAVKTAIALLFAFVPLLLLVLVGLIAFKIGRGKRRRLRQRRSDWLDRL